MNLRLLKIESARSGPFATAVFGLPETKSKWYAHCLIENPSAQIDKKLKTVQNKHPQLLNIINSKHRFLHFSFPVDENSDTYLPPYIEKFLAEGK